MEDRTKDVILTILPLLLYYTLSQFQVDYNALLRSQALSKYAKKRRVKQRIKWSHLNQRISEKQFRRMFRMTRDCFSELCNLIKTKVGEKEFKSESYIDGFLVDKDSMYMTHAKTSGGYISGEVKVGIALRILAGGNPYDLGVLFDIYPKHCNLIMFEVLSKWIIHPKIGGIDFYRFINDNEAMRKVSDGFSKRSNGVLKGVIGALDGWLVRIERPSLWKDGIKNVTSFFFKKRILCVKCTMYSG